MGIALGSTKINNVSIGLEEVQTVKNAVTDIKSALTEKGVTVPDGTGISDLAALISGIEVGGGFDFGGTALEFVSGSFTVTEDTIVNTMFASSSPLNLPFTKIHSNTTTNKTRGRWFFLWDSTPDASASSTASEIYSNATANQILFAYNFFVYSAGNRNTGGYSYKTSSGMSGGGGYWIGSDYYNVYTTDSTRFFGAGRTYQWVAWATKAVWD